MTILNDELYIGTTWGCIIVSEKSTLRPITIFRPYEEDVKVIIPLSKSKDSTPLLATVGRGYRNLLSRYTEVSTIFGGNLQSPVVNVSSLTASKQNMFALLWRAEHWNAT